MTERRAAVRQGSGKEHGERMDGTPARRLANASAGEAAKHTLRDESVGERF